MIFVFSQTDALLSGIMSHFMCLESTAAGRPFRVSGVCVFEIGGGIFLFLEDVERIVKKHFLSGIVSTYLYIVNSRWPPVSFLGACAERLGRRKIRRSLVLSVLPFFVDLFSK